jgi:hypothetical protein
MGEEDKQLHEALDSLRLISATVTRTRRETWGSNSATPMLVLGGGMLLGTLGSPFFMDWLESVWWVLIGITITGAMVFLRAQQISSMSKAVRWMLRRHALIWLGVNVQGWALTLLSLLYNAYPPQYTLTLWMIIIGVHFITSGLFSQSLFIVMGVVYVTIATATALFWPSAEVFNMGFMAAGIISGLGFITLGLYLRRGQRDAMRPADLSLRHSEVSS